MEKERKLELWLPLAAVGLFAISFFALSKKQRDATLERDGHKCRATVKHECNEKDHPLEVDHILPQRYLALFGVDPDWPGNVLSKCRNAHDIKHPDRIPARKKYHQLKEQGIDSFKQLGAERNKKLEERLIYWNDQNDRADQVMAMKLTQLAILKGWLFPDKPKKREKVK